MLKIILAAANCSNNSFQITNQIEKYNKNSSENIDITLSKSFYTSNSLVEDLPLFTAIPSVVILLLLHLVYVFVVGHKWSPWLTFLLSKEFNYLHKSLQYIHDNFPNILHVTFCFMLFIILLPLLLTLWLTVLCYRKCVYYFIKVS